MQKRYWFKAKRYGWGWYPSTWQGWTILGLFILAILWNTSHIDSTSMTIGPFVVENLVLVTLLIVICYQTGEPPKWRWGDKTSKKR